MQYKPFRMFFHVSLGVLFLLSIVMFPLENSHSAVAISPAYITVKLDKGRPSGAFTITNVGKKEERYRVRVFAFNVSAKAGGIEEIDAKDQYSLVPLIRFNPKEFTLPVKMKRKVRFTILPRKLKPNREYRAIMELMSLNRTIARSEDDKGNKYKFEVIESIMVPIFGLNGKVRYQGSVEEVKLISQEDKPQLQILVRNTGEGRIQVHGNYEIVNPTGSTIAKGPLKRGHVYPKSKRWFYRNIEDGLKGGNYTVKVLFDCPQLSGTLKEEVQLVWPTSS